jgi:peptidyl-prolyl cis-trans isomerase SurA
MRLATQILSFFSLFVFLAVPAGQAAANSEGIAAVVNTDVISVSDVNERMKLIMASSGFPDNQQVRAQITHQVLNGLIEEQLKLQEARRLDLLVTQEEIDQGFATIAQQNNFPPEHFREMLVRAGINFSTLEKQIESQIAWSKVVQNVLYPQVVVSDNDVDDFLNRLHDSKGAYEYLMSEIFLPVDSPQEEGDIRQLARDLSDQIKAGQAPFFQVAQQFSRTAGAINGGDLGWVQQAHLNEDVGKAVADMEAGQVSDPVRSVNGYHILLLRESRQITEENMPPRDVVMQNIGMQRLERAQRRHFLDLKSAAFIENRVGL